jgi:hypothetical protein
LKEDELLPPSVRAKIQEVDDRVKKKDQAPAVTELPHEPVVDFGYYPNDTEDS